VARRREAAQPIRIVHLVLGLNVGGLEQVVYDLVRYTNTQRFSVRVVCLGEIGAWGPKFQAVGVPVEGLGVLGRRTLPRVMALARRLRELCPDILHTHNLTPHLVGSLAARVAGSVVVVHTKHGRNYPHTRRRALAGRIASWFSKKIIGVSRDAAEEALRTEKVSAQKIDVIINGIDLTRFPLVTRRSRGVPQRAIHVSRIDYASKDQRTLIQAARIVANAEPDFVLDIVGDGPDRADLEAFCDELQLRKHVNFLGFRDDVHERLSQAEFFVLSSVTEGLSLALLEAAASGLAIVATAVGGNPEIVDDGVTGLLVPARAAEDLAGAILTLWRDPQRAARMGIAGRRLVEDRFDLQRTVRQYERIYESLIRADVHV